MILDIDVYSSTINRIFLFLMVTFTLAGDFIIICSRYTLSLGYVAFIPSNIKSIDFCFPFAIAQLSCGSKFPFFSPNPHAFPHINLTSTPKL